jgi:hypothetical protein
LAGAARAKPLKGLERVKGIEPSSSAWKAVALPLSYTRMGRHDGLAYTLHSKQRLVGEAGLEPAKA